MKRETRTSLVNILGSNRKSARARALRMETLENRELLSASTLQEALAIDALTSAPALVATNPADAPIDLSNAELDAPVVTTTADSGEGSLRWAVENAAEGATITFADGLQGTISVKKQIEISKSITIDASAADITVSGGNSSRIFRIAGEFNAKTGVATEDGTINVSITGLTLTEGKGSGTSIKGTYGTKTKTYGGAIWAQAVDLTLTDVVFTANSSTKNGGAIAIGSGSLTINAGKFENNAGLGGAIYASNATLTVDSASSFTNNSGANGGAIMLSGADATLNATFIENTASGNGGAVYATSGASIEASGAVFNSNTAKQGGALYLNGSSVSGTYKFTGNTASSAGGAVSLNADSKATFTDSVFSGDSATTKGGGIAISASSLETFGGKFDGEKSKSGGAIYMQSGTAVLNDTDLLGNEATSTYGGAVYALKGTVEINGGTSSGNSSKMRGGALYAQGASGDKASVTVSRATVENNEASSGAAIGTGGYTDVTVKNSVLVENTATSGSALWLTSSELSIVNATIANNDGSALYAVKSSGEIANTIIATNENDAQLSSSTITASNTITGSSALTGEGSSNIIVYNEGDTLFEDADNGDYSLAKGSIAYNAGDSSYVDEGDESLNGDDRATSDIISIGAYEATYREDPSGESAYVVTSLENVVDAYDGAITLQEAIANAAKNGGTVTFSEDLKGQTIAVSESIEIAESVVIDGAGVVFAGEGDYVFRVTGGETAIKNAEFTGYGVSVADATLTISESSFANGTGVLAENAVVTVSDTNFSSAKTGVSAVNSNVALVNVVASESEIVVLASGGSVEASGSTFTQNATAISSVDANVSIVNSIAKQNVAFVSASGGTTTVKNSLVAENGTAFSLISGEIALVNVTVANNETGLLASEATAVLKNTIIAQNDADVSASDSTLVAYNTLSSFTAWTDGAKNYEYVAGAPLFSEAGVYTLADNTEEQDNYAIDGGDNSYVDWDYDLTGKNARIYDNGSSKIAVDLGAYESEYIRVTPETPSVVVTTLSDVVDPYDELISLREAIEVYSVSGDTVTFDESLAGQTITLNGTQISVKKDVVVDGTGLGITVSGDGKSRVFNFELDVTGGLIGLTISGGKKDSGAGVYIAARTKVLVASCIIKGNTYSDIKKATLGSGVYSDSDDTVVTNCVIAENTGSGVDGSADGFYGAGSIYNSTVTKNTGGSGIVAGYNNSLYVYNTIGYKNGLNDISKGYGDLYVYNVVVDYYSYTEAYNLINYSSWKPLFADFENGDYTLAEGSQGINAGNNEYVTTETDLAGNARIQGGVVDLGAYEAYVWTEDPSSIVTTLSDVVDPTDGQISLREAIAYATADAGLGGTITFAEDLAGGTITLESQLTVGGSLTVDAGELGITVSGEGQTRVFEIEENAVVTLSGLTVAKGIASADGGDADDEDLYETKGGGVKINSGATVAINNCSIVENTDGSGDYGYGAGVWVGSGATVTISKSEILRNSIGYGYGAGLYIGSNAQVAIVESSVSENACEEGMGAGIFVEGSLVLTDSVLNGNALDPTINDYWSGGMADSSEGGAICIGSEAVATISGCQITGNSGGLGGAIYVNVSWEESVRLNLVNSVLSNNVSTYGGAVYSAAITEDVYLENCLVTGNSASINGGGIWGYATVVGSTVVGNTAKEGGGICVQTWDLGAGGEIYVYSAVRNSIVLDNEGGNISEVALRGMKSAATLAYVLTEGASELSSWAESVNYEYDSSKPLFEDGSYALAEGSQAIDAGNNGSVMSETDLAGEARIFGGTVDLGAYEYQGSADPDAGALLDAFAEYFDEELFVEF